YVCMLCMYVCNILFLEPRFESFSFLLPRFFVLPDDSDVSPCMYVCMYVCMYLYVCMYVFVCMYGWMYVCMYVITSGEEVVTGRSSVPSLNVCVCMYVCTLLF